MEVWGVFDKFHVWPTLPKISLATLDGQIVDSEIVEESEMRDAPKSTWCIKPSGSLDTSNVMILLIRMRKYTSNICSCIILPDGHINWN